MNANKPGRLVVQPKPIEDIQVASWERAHQILLKNMERYDQALKRLAMGKMDHGTGL